MKKLFLLVCGLCSSTSLVYAGTSGDIIFRNYSSSSILVNQISDLFVGTSLPSGQYTIPPATATNITNSSVLVINTATSAQSGAVSYSLSSGRDFTDDLGSVNYGIFLGNSVMCAFPYNQTALNYCSSSLSQYNNGLRYPKTSISQDGQYFMRTHMNPGNGTQQVVDIYHMGTLLYFGFPVTTNLDGPADIAMSPDNTNIFVINSTNNTMAIFSMSNEKITNINTTWTEDSPSGVAVTPDGQYVYVTNKGRNSVSMFSVLANANVKYSGYVATGNSPSAIKVGPNGKYAYVLNGSDNTIQSYAIGDSGALTSNTKSLTSTGNYPISMAITPNSNNGEFIYVVNALDSTISMYSANEGMLTSGQVVSVSDNEMGNSFPTSIAITPNNKYAYVTDSNDNKVSMFSIENDGKLKLIGRVSTGNHPSHITVSPLNDYVYVTNKYDSTVSVYSIGDGGVLSNVSQPINTGKSPVGMAITSDDKHAFIIGNQDSTMFHYTIPPTVPGQ